MAESPILEASLNPRRGRGEGQFFMGGLVFLSTHINDALAEASNAVERKDKLALEAVLKELDTYIQYSVSAEQDRKLGRLFINQVD